MTFESFTGKLHKLSVESGIGKGLKHIGYKIILQLEAEQTASHINPVRFPEEFNQPLRMLLVSGQLVMLPDHGFYFTLPLPFSVFFKVVAGKKL